MASNDRKTAAKPENTGLSAGDKAKYRTVSKYIILTFFICVILFEIVHNIGAVGSSLSSLVNVLSPFIIAFLIAYFINPLATKIDQFLLFLSKKLIKKEPHRRIRVARKIFSLIISYAIIIGFIAAFFAIVIPQILTSLTRLLSQIPDYYDMLTGLMNNIQEQYPNLNLDFISNMINDALPNALTSLQNYITSLMPKLYDIGKGLITWVINIILAFIISCYIMTGKNRIKSAIKRFCYAFFHNKPAGSILYTMRQCSNIFSRFLIGKTIDSLIIGILCLILMRILRLDYSVLISLIVGVTNMIPYFGPFVGGIFGILILLLVEPQQALIFLIMIFILQQFDGGILGPKILGDSTGLHPIWVIFAIVVGGAVGGVIGMFLGVPIVAVLVYLLNSYLDYRLYRKGMNPDLSNVDESAASEEDSMNIFIRGSETIGNAESFKGYDYRNVKNDFDSERADDSESAREKFRRRAMEHMSGNNRRKETDGSEKDSTGENH